MPTADEHDETSRPEPRPAPLQNFIEQLRKNLPPPPPAMTLEAVIAVQDHLGPDAKGRRQALCFRCGRTPTEVGDYTAEAQELGITPDDFVRIEEGTYNHEGARFACNACYIALGQPSSPRGWRAP